MQYIYKYNSPLGEITASSDGENLIGLWFDDQKYYADTLSHNTVEKKLPIFEQTKQWLDCYFRGEKPSFTPSIALEGTPFRLAVWEILKKIPYGEIITYADIAKAVAKKKGITRMSSQAVGGAIGHNPISIIVPCHRVVGSNGSLTGYAGGIGRKVKLLTLENVNQANLFIPKKGTAL